MQTIKNNIISQYEIKKSKFITLLFRIDNSNEVSELLKYAKVKYKDATHYCYAYKLDNTLKFSDDGEPSGTAGLPILEILNKKNITNILCIVIRYFGGIKLGASGLIRAYSNAVLGAIDNCQTIELVDGYLLEIKTSYNKQKQYDYKFKDKIIEKIFNEQVIYYINIALDEIYSLKNINYKVIREVLVERKK